MNITGAYHSAVIAYVERIGGTDAWIDRCVGTHPQLRFRFGEADYKIGVSNTPSSTNAIWYKRRDIRRLIGLGRSRVIGCRRPDRERRVRPERLVQLAPPLPDWRDALRRHPLYLALAAEAA